MYRSLGLVGLSLLWVLHSQAQPQSTPDTVLQARLDSLVHGFSGTVGLYVRHLSTGRTVAINADVVFPSASLIKVPILVKTFDAISKSKLGYHQRIIYRDTLRTVGAGLLSAFKNGSEVEVSEALMLMTAMSDNTAALWLQHLAGGGKAVNGWLKVNGFKETRVNAGTPGRLKQWKQYNWGQTTPREMAELLVMIREGRAVSPSASEEMYRLLTRSYWSTEALSQIPPYVQAASKQGSVARARSEVVLVNAPHGDYVFCLMTSDQEDESWGSDNEGFVLLRDVSRTLWQHFEPDADWQPTAFGK
ncbi:MAG TPA: serine hydrolase [Rhodothermales bacterium]|nr:serine hydrolase [Rhodothermales bacterium]